MFDNIVFGKGEHFCSAILLLNIDEHAYISHNCNSYWLSGFFYDTDAIIYKDSKEGIKLAKMIQQHSVDNDAKNLLKIKNYIETLLIKKIKPEELKMKIQNIEKNAYRNGQEDKANQIRVALGLGEY